LETLFVNLPSKNSVDFWTSSFFGFLFDLNTSATHHNPIICTGKKQNALKRKQISGSLVRSDGGGGNFLLLTNQQRNEKQLNNILISIAPKFVH
jgi:hypothetical protein